MFNWGKEPYLVEADTSVAQVIVEKNGNDVFRSVPLRATEDMVLRDEPKLVPTDYVQEMDIDEFGQIHGHLKHATVFKGIIDNDYHNTTVCYTIPHQTIDIKNGDVIGEMKIYKFAKDVYLNGKVSELVRNGGFGSTGNYNLCIFFINKFYSITN